MKNKTRCKRCGGYYNNSFFLVMNGKKSKPRYYKTCKLCRMNRRKTIREIVNRKAERLIRGHESRMILSGKISDRGELRKKYGWEPKRIVSAIMSKISGDETCDCGVRFSELELGDISIDISNPETEPYYSTNTRIICHRCNSIKSSMTQKEWAEYCEDSQEWHRIQYEISNGNPFAGLPLECRG